MSEVGEVPFVPLGIVTKKNRAADRLERHLGIEITNPPAAIPLTVWNNALIILKSPYLKNHLGLELSSKPKILDSDKDLGVYIPRSNVYVYVPNLPNEEHVKVSLHENAHAYLYQMNPDIHEYRRRYFNGLVDSDSISLGNTDEKANVYKTFDEGFAEWTAYEAMGRMLNMHPDKSSHYHGLTVLEKMEESLESEQNVDQLSDEKFDKVFFGNPYISGHWFVNKVMSSLKESGLSTAEGMTLLALQPPESTQDVINPHIYLKNLI